jgi:hypothetical protein
VRQLVVIVKEVWSVSCSSAVLRIQGTVAEETCRHFYTAVVFPGHGTDMTSHVFSPALVRDEGRSALYEPAVSSDLELTRLRWSTYRVEYFGGGGNSNLFGA